MSRRRPTSRRRAPSTWTIVSLLLLLLAAYLISEGYIVFDNNGIRFGERVEPAVTQVSGGAIEAFFTTPALIYPDRPDSRRTTPIEQALINDIDAAAQTVDLVTFEYNLDSIAEALVRAEQRGVDVRVALDRENLEKPEMSAWAGTVEQAGIRVDWQDSDAFLHSKFVIVDNRLVWTGSWNATVNDTYRNNNNLLRITIPAIVANYAAEFAQMDNGRFSTSKTSVAPNPVVRADGVTIETYFSPQDDVAARVVQQIEQAQSSIEFMAFSYTSDPIADAMIDRNDRGVPVRGVFERRNAGGTGAEFDRLNEAGVDVLEDGNCYTMHHKVIIIDDHIVITGSYNFSRRAEETNDENLLIIDDPEIARAYLAEFERVYRQARQPTRCG